MELRARLVVFVVIAAGLAASVGAREFYEPKKLSKRQQAIVDAAPLGSEGNPVRCEAPKGERAYLNRLRCPSGDAPVYERAGSVGEGPYKTIMDVYEVMCAEWPDAVSIYMDMYHTGYTESRPVPQFSIVAPK
jgi:hypothetical protein